MTVSSITNKQSYNGNGSQSVFAYTFKIFADTDVKVYVGTSLKTLSTHYTLSGVGSAGGGNVTFTAGNIPAVGTGNVTILRSLALTQGVDLVNYGRFDAEVIEAQYDKLTMMVQQLQEQADRTIRFSTTVSDAGGVEITDTVAERSGKVLAYDANGDLSVANELGDWQGNWSTTTVYAVRDLVLDSVTNNVYTCLISHIAGTLSTDVAASKWALVINAAAVAASASAAAADLVLTNADVVLTNADVVLTNADVVLTHADVVLAEADKVQTALDRIATGADVTTATTKASEASTSASNAASSLATFTGQYVSQATAPSSPSEGDLWFDTTANTMKVYDGSGFINAVSSVNGIENSVQHTATAGQTSFTATYDAGFLQVYLNGLRLDAEDYTATNGSTVVLGTGATLNDVVFIHSFGTFVLANHYTKSEDDALLAAKATVADFTSTGIDDNATSTAITIDGAGDLVLAGGVYLGGTGAANKLDDYEEGTFTPTYVSGIAATVYTYQTGRYTKIGNTVTFHIDISASTSTVTGDGVRIGGLPFTSAANPCGGAFPQYNGGLVNDNSKTVTYHVTTGVTEIRMYLVTGSVAGNATYISQSGRIIISGLYQVA